MRDYYKWCVELLNNWKQKNVENIVNLFDENVEYYETPTEQINTIKEIRKMFFLKECIGYLLFKESFRIAFRLVMKKDKTETYDITSRKTVRHAG